MTHAWVVLTGPDGRETAAPSDTELAAALSELSAPQQGGAEREPAVAALRFGYDDGLMYVAEVNSKGEINFEEWSDRDCEIALADPRRMHADQAQALQLWSMLAHRQVAKIRALDWIEGG
jgi:hypothetical protein